jgi:phosphoribosylglycinamide formyltransferase-1
MTKTLRIGAFISGTGSNLQAIIDACTKGTLPGRVVFIGSDKATAAGLDKGKRYAIPTFTVDYDKIIQTYRQDSKNIALPPDFNLEEIRNKQSLLPVDGDPLATAEFLETRAIAEAALLKKMQPYPFDLLVLAGFMRVLTPYFIDRVNASADTPRILNIHPALLPSFPGTNGYEDTFRYGCKVAGCTVHFVDYGEDSGPIVGQRAFPIQNEDTLETVREKGLAHEWELYPECILLFAQNRLKLIEMEGEPENRAGKKRKVVKILSE